MVLSQVDFNKCWVKTFKKLQFLHVAFICKFVNIRIPLLGFFHRRGVAFFFVRPQDLDVLLYHKCNLLSTTVLDFVNRLPV